MHSEIVTKHRSFFIPWVATSVVLVVALTCLGLVAHDLTATELALKQIIPNANASLAAERHALDEVKRCTDRLNVEPMHNASLTYSQSCYGSILVQTTGFDDDVTVGLCHLHFTSSCSR